MLCSVHTCNVLVRSGHEKHSASSLPRSKELDKDQWLRVDGGLERVLGDTDDIGGLLGIRVCNDERCESDYRSR